MTEQPPTLVHLYLNPDGPFRSISELPQSEAARLMDQMTEANTWHPPRFTKENRERYINARRRAERRLHAAFIAKGGCPRRRHPYYLLLETPEVQSFWPNARRARIPVDEIPSELLSFTYIDSMVCDALLHEPDRVPGNCTQFAGLDCLDEVYRLEELPNLIETFGFPEGTYIEAQVWADEPLQPHQTSNKSPMATPSKSSD